MRQSRWHGVAVAALLLTVPGTAAADPFHLTISAPSFIIPIGNQSGTLTVFSDGSAPQVSGFNALGSQTVTVSGRSTSTGYLTLNLFFSGLPLGSADHVVNDAFIQFTVRDLDFLTDNVARRITLREMAVLNAVNGAPLQSPINLADYLPPGTTTTDDRTITLRPIDLIPPLSSADFTDPFILSIGLTATVRNDNDGAVTLRNTPEGLMAGINLTGDATPIPRVPEPSSLLLLGLGLAASARRLRSRVTA